MRHYEITFLVHPDQSEQVPAMIDRYKDLVASGHGNIHRVENWGRRRLAYMINDVYKAHYVMLNIECNLNVLGEIEKNFKFNDSILRHLVIRRKTAITEESPIAKEKQREDAQEAEEVARQTASAIDTDAGSDKDDKDDKDIESDEKLAESAETSSESLEPLISPDENAFDETALDEAILDEDALAEDALEDEAIKEAALKDGGIV